VIGNVDFYHEEYSIFHQSFLICNIYHYYHFSLEIMPNKIKTTFKPLTQDLNTLYRQSEEILVPTLINSISLTDDQKLNISNRATTLIEGARSQKNKIMSVQCLFEIKLVQATG